MKEKTRRTLGAALALWMALAGSTALAEAATSAASVETAADISADEKAFRGIPWAYTMEQVAEVEAGRQRAKTVTVTKNVLLYDMEAGKLTYHFADGVMTAREFQMKRGGRAEYASLFYSVCLRYGVPFSATDRKAVWQVGPLNVTLRRGDALTVTYALDLGGQGGAP